MSFLFVLGLGLGAVIARAAEAADPAFRQRAGDDPRWAAPDWDDSDWTPGRTVPSRAGIYWVRAVVPLTTDRKIDLPQWLLPNQRLLSTTSQVDVMWFAAPFSYEVYWDGRLIGRNGVVGRTREEEVVGLLDNILPIPQELLGAGKHVVAVRLSSFHYNFPAKEFGAGFILANIAELPTNEIRRVAFPLVGVGGAVLVGLISLVMFRLADRWRPMLLLGCASFALALFYFLVAWRWLHNDPYDWFYPRLVAATWVMTAVAMLFPWLLLEQFGAPRRLWWMAAQVPLIALAWSLSPLYEFKSLFLCYAMLELCLAIAAWAAWRKRPGARWVLAVVVLGLAIVRTDRREFLHPSFFLTFGLFVLVVFATLATQVRAHRQQAQAATLAAARLETELLKKNIQPHFLLNTLATIMEVIEREPRTAVTMIESLAGEFRILARVAGEKLIPLAQEIELCRAHLRIMSLRKGARCTLEVAVAVDGRALVPPALFHTLVENGLTHLMPRAGEQQFALNVAHGGGRVRYTFRAKGEPVAPRTAGREAAHEGTGLRYIRARLEESFSGDWQLAGGPTADGWETIIDLGAAGPRPDATGADLIARSATAQRAGT